MKTATTIKEYQLYIDEVKKSKKSMQVKIEMEDEELEKGREELNLEGVEVVVGNDYDEIKPA